MNFFKLYIGDYQRDTGTLSLAEHGAYLLMLQHFYATESPLPTGRDLHRLLRCETKAERAAVDSVVARFWKETDAGLINERSIKEFGRAAEISETNRSIALAREAKKREKREHEQSTNRAPSVARTKHEQSTNQTPDTRHQTKHHQVDTHTQHQPPEGVCVSPLADCCRAMVEAGIPATKINHGHPKLLALVEAGATVIEFGETARECVSKGNPTFAYVLGTMTRRREQAAATQLHHGAMPRKPTPGQRTADAAQRWLESQPTEEHHDALGQA